MASYKRLKNIARNFSHSFMSLMNFEEGYYIMDVVAREMYLHNLLELKVDILEARLLHENISNLLLDMSISYYSNKFFIRMLKAEGFAKESIKSAILTIHYDFENQKEEGDSIFIPFRCSLEIVDDRDKLHIGEIEDTNLLSSEFFEKNFSYKGCMSRSHSDS